MKTRVKVFSYATGEGTTIVDAGLESHINDWLNQCDGKVLFVTQSESARPNAAQHITVCIWYTSDLDA